ncbi:MAG: phenylalanine--tRNA ligase beta subunit-related protein [Patescibacteria group bacterium]
MTNENRIPDMPEVTINQEIRTLGPNLRLGILRASVVVKPSTSETKEILNKNALISSYGLTVDSLKELQEILAFRDFYKKLGKDPSRYRPSSEMLLRRVIQGKGLYNINNVVDLMNAVSMNSKFPMGFYDTHNIQGKVMLRIGKEGESFPGIRKEDVNVESLPVFADDFGPFGNPTSDSERTMIKPETKKIMVVIFSFSQENSKTLEEVGEKAKFLLRKFASGEDLSFNVV